MPRVLTDRQADVLHHLCAGGSRPEAATALGIRPATLASSLTEIRRRLGTRDLAELCARCPDDLAAATDRERRRRIAQDETNRTT